MRIAEHFRESMICKGFNTHMRQKEFKSYICALYEGEKNELFHYIYELYLYVSEMLASPVNSKKSYFQLMSQLKRYEQFLYSIMRS